MLYGLVLYPCVCPVAERATAGAFGAGSQARLHEVRAAVCACTAFLLPMAVPLTVLMLCPVQSDVEHPEQLVSVCQPVGVEW